MGLKANEAIDLTIMARHPIDSEEQDSSKLLVINDINVLTWAIWIKTFIRLSLDKAPLLLSIHEKYMVLIEQAS